MICAHCGLVIEFPQSNQKYHFRCAAEVNRERSRQSAKRTRELRRQRKREERSKA